MTLAQQQLPGSNSKRNLPRLKGKVVSVEHHQETMVKGFEQTYHFFMKNRDELLAADGPLAFFQNASVRFVFRATNISSDAAAPNWPNFLTAASRHDIHAKIFDVN